MAVRCLSSPFSPPSNPVNPRVLISKSVSLVSANSHRPFVTSERNHRIYSLRKAKGSAEGDLLTREVDIAANKADDKDYGVFSIHHVGLLCENLEKSLAFYKDLLGRPEHGGRDRHACIAIRDVSKLKAIFDRAGIRYTLSRSGRPAIFTRDPDGNALEFTQVD
uniref:Uncharacterized protein LOC105040397 isoform X3 n=1 Tax=Elaeis guineensis var. tenera TaxID=51953 RepID=A0A6I9QYH9_ELAGV|nr:uncharacterized protein LOC105040397 isoform X3 [Elaeis guineensis]